MDETLVIGLGLVYLVVLLGIGWWNDPRVLPDKAGRWMYVWSLGVFCTAWTFYGSIGRAAGQGLEFLAIYLGASLSMGLSPYIFKRMAQLKQIHRFNSVADFMSGRYGQHVGLGAFVTLVCLFGVIPYLALQIRAISFSYIQITSVIHESRVPNWWQDPAFYLTLFLAAFTIFLGTRSLDATEKKTGLMTAMAVESMVKLVAFLAAAIWICFAVFTSPFEIFQRASEQGFIHVMMIQDQGKWFFLLLVSFLAFPFLPRQFHAGIVENRDVSHVNTASWAFPLYLWAMNLLVLPVALAGLLVFQDQGKGAEAYLLALPLHFGQNGLALLVFLGGLSAATSMLIVSTLALSTMVSNHWVMPLALHYDARTEASGRLRQILQWARRLAILGLLVMAYAFDHWVTHEDSLVSTGLLSFAALAQLAPAGLGGLFWKNGTRKGASAGILAGFLLWFYTLILPTLAHAGWLDFSSWAAPDAGIKYWIQPTQFLGLQGLDATSQGIFWSLLVNVVCYVVFSVNDRPDANERQQALLFVEGEAAADARFSPRNKAGKGLSIKALQDQLAIFLGASKADAILRAWAVRHGVVFSPASPASPELLAYGQRMLSGVMGAASARLMMSALVDEEIMEKTEVLTVLHESSQILELNRELRKKSVELERASRELIRINEALRQSDALKDEFLSTVTHELRTPLTSIRAMSEILLDFPDLTEAEQQRYLTAIVKEAERLGHLISQVLILERFESGRYTLSQTEVALEGWLEEEVARLKPLAENRKVNLHWTSVQPLGVFKMDMNLMSQVMYNILSNALRYAPEHSGEVQLVAEKSEETLVFRVLDNGPGIPEEDLPQIFEKFYQSRPRKQATKPEGSGLGLAISQKIIQAHGGQILAENRPEGGAVFTMILPFNHLND